MIGKVCGVYLGNNLLRSSWHKAKKMQGGYRRRQIRSYRSSSASHSSFSAALIWESILAILARMDSRVAGLRFLRSTASNSSRSLRSQFTRDWTAES